jgi:hypothetical protein
VSVPESISTLAFAQRVASVQLGRARASSRGKEELDNRRLRAELTAAHAGRHLSSPVDTPGYCIQLG